VDLVGHDWGGGFTLRAASLRPDLLHSWVSYAAGVGDVEFRWHEFAKIWQTPGAGEQFFRD
jgi:pimeloyl-ACP methyl ester carboxylesterase